jgi:tetratricopeptide (TPR) repeat protein
MHCTSPLSLVFLVVSGCAPKEEASASHIAPVEAVAPLAGERALSYRAGEGQTDRRIAHAQDLARRAPESIEPYRSLAALFFRAYRETGDAEHLRRADDAATAALERDPNDSLSLSISGLLAMQGHRFEDAAAIADRVLGNDPEDTTALLLRGDAELELGQYDRALEDYQRANDLRPDLRTYNRAAYMRWLHGDSQGSLELLELAIDAASSRDPESAAWCWVDLANVHWHLGNDVQVRVALDNALGLVPDYAPALRLRSKAEARRGDRAAAIATLEQVIARSETVGDLLALADLFEADGRTAAAAERVRRAEEIGREDPRALAVYRARRDEDVGRALDTTEREIERRSDVYTRAAHAIALARAGRAAEAREEMDRALALGSTDLTLWLDDALVRIEAGDREGARASLDRVVAENRFADEWLADRLEQEIGGER